MSDTQVKKIYIDILNQISKIYEQYQTKSRQMKQQNSKKTNGSIDKAQNQLFQNIQNKLEPELGKLVTQMEKVPVLKGKYAGQVRSCHNSIKNILRKRSLNFKVNKQLNQLYDRTTRSIMDIRKKIPIASQSTFLCCGVNGLKQMEQVFHGFRPEAARWQMIEILQSKGMVDNYICPEFIEKQYNFIRDILKANWPKQKQAKVQIKQKIVERQKLVYVNKQGFNPLDQANQFIFGINKEQNIFHGLKIYHRQADNKNMDACAFLGKVYEEGTLLPQDLPKSVDYYKRTLSLNHPYAAYRFALKMIKGKLQRNGQNVDDLKKGFQLLSSINQQKNPCPQALAQLAYLYEHGQFADDQMGLFKVDIDLKKAISLNEKARSLNLPRAVNNLGLLYYNNKNMNPKNPNEKIESEQVKNKNIKKALQYFFQAQKLGYPEAFYNLGRIHKQQKQHQKALHYFYQGGLKHDYMCKISFAYQLINQTSIQKQQYEDHYQLAKRWLQETVQYLTSVNDSQPHQKDSTLLQKNKRNLAKGQALYYLGLFYEHGFGVEKSSKRAVHYYLQAFATEYPPAKNKIGDCYFSGYGTPVNRQLAIGFYVNAAELGNSDAMVNLGTIYLNGIPGLIERNYNRAHEYFCEAMDHQNSDANIHLSYMYKNGFGIEQDQQLAKKLLQQAANKKNSTALYMLKELGQAFNQNLYYDNLENEFFSAPKRINIHDIVAQISGIN